MIPESRLGVSGGLGVWGVAGGLRWAYPAARGIRLAGNTVVPDHGASTEASVELVVCDR